MACYFLDQDDENLDMAKTYAFGAAQPVMPAFGVMKGSMYQSKLASFSRLSSKNAGGLSVRFGISPPLLQCLTSCLLLAETRKEKETSRLGQWHAHVFFARTHRS